MLGHVVMAPSTLGTFLRGHTFGNVRQFDSVNAEALRRAWAAGAGPDPAKALVIDIDSTICQVYGHAKQGATYGYTKVRGYHPLCRHRHNGCYVARRIMLQQERWPCVGAGPGRGWWGVRSA